MAIFKRSDSKYYWTKFHFRGRVIQQSTRCESIRAAETFETNLKAQLNLQRIGVEDVNAWEPDALPFKDAVASFFEYLDDVKPSTRRRYETAAKPLIEYFGKIPVGRIDADHVIRYRKYRRTEKHKAPARLLKRNPKARTNKPLRPATINRETTLISMIYSHLRTVKKMKLASPTADVKQLKENNISERVVEIDELIKYLRHGSPTLRDVARLMYYCGLRPGEVTSLTVNDINFRAGVIVIREGKTDSARRRVPLPNNARHILGRRCRNAHNGLLFPGGKAGQGQVPLVKLNNAHNAAIARSGVVPFRLYDLRHTWATDLHAAGADLETLRVLGGWANLAMLKRYVKPNDAKKALESEKLVEYRSNVIPFRNAA